MSTPAFCGVAVYLGWAYLELGQVKAHLPIGAIVFGALLVGVPYLALFVVPDLHWIRSDIESVNGGFNPVAAVRCPHRLLQSCRRRPSRWDLPLEARPPGDVDRRSCRGADDTIPAAAGGDPRHGTGKPPVPALPPFR